MKPNPAKRYAASVLTHGAAELLLMAIRMLQTATTWNKKGLSNKEYVILKETTPLLTAAQVRLTAINSRFERTLDKDYGWNDR